ncbi:MAG: lipoprotein-releasing ABC transporter permease subunit [Spongiibacteraceae bacterium]
MRQLAFFIGSRYTADRSSNRLVSFLSWVSMLGLVVGVALLVVVLSVMNGFDKEMRSRILSLVPHISMQPWSETDSDWRELQLAVNTHPAVTGSAPYIQGNLMLIKAARVEPGLLVGIDPQAEQGVSRLGEFLDLSLLAEGEKNIALGQALAQKLGMVVGDFVTVGVPLQVNGRHSMRFDKLRLVALVNTGTELDQQTILVHLSLAQKLLPADTEISLKLSVDDVFAAPSIAWELSAVHGRDYMLRDWSQQFGNMYHAIQMSKRLVIIMLLAVVAVAVFNVVSTLVIVVNDKRSDIAILRSQGASQGLILSSFLIYGAIIGAVGATLGGVLGVALSLGVSDAVAMIERVFEINLLQSDVYPINYLPTDVRGLDVLSVCLVSYAMSVLATLYPAWRASRLPPAEALQHG